MNIRRLFYREYPFKILSDEKLSGAFNAYKKIICCQPEIFYWIKHVEKIFLITEFHHISMRKYHGKELVLVQKDKVSYYRLPGVKIGGRGDSLSGLYYLKIKDCMEDDYFLTVYKNKCNYLLISNISTTPSVDQGKYICLERHTLEPNKFVDEMNLTILKGLEWFYQTGLVQDGYENHALHKIAPSLGGITNDIDAILERIYHEDSMMNKRIATGVL